ncbi:MAG: 50S ribosomal protein L34 [Planctomycetes bacterium]|nr:50S ribosomal protein L34 [Planctomycetota bacterium]
MHYPRRNSRIKRSRKQGFRARMKTVGGRRIINAKRRRGTHKINVAA